MRKIHQYYNIDILMKLDEINVNQTHICVLRKKHGANELFVDFPKLHFPYDNQLIELQYMSENNNRSVVELIAFVENSKLSILMKSFDFCPNLSGAWQSCPCIKKMENYEYRKLLIDYDQKIREAKDAEECEKEKEKKRNFIYSERKSFYASIKGHVLPYLLECKYNELGKDNTVLAFSHRRIGWSKPEFHLSDDLSVIYKTNFGYGFSSYFYTNIKYKEIDILPYSDWIRYLHADKSEIIRYTRKHSLDNNEWIQTMDFTAEMYNSSVQEPHRFVENWIINEVDEMVKGLEKLLNENKDYEVIKSYSHRNTSFTLMGRKLIRFKGEKTAGALSFMDKLKELNSIYSGIELYIEKIMTCNMNIYPKLIAEIKLINSELDDLNKEISNILPEWEKHVNTKKEYDAVQNEIYEKVKNDPQYLNNDLVRSDGRTCIYVWQQETDKRFIKKHPEYGEFLKKYTLITEKYDNLKNEISELRRLILEFEGYQFTIFKYFDYVNRSKELIA